MRPCMQKIWALLRFALLIRYAEKIKKKETKNIRLTRHQADRATH